MDTSSYSPKQLQAEIDRLNREVYRLKAVRDVWAEQPHSTADLLSHLVDLVPAAITIFQDNRIVYANRAAFENVGIQPSDDNLQRLLDCLTPADKNQVRQRAADRHGGKPDVPDVYELAIRTSSGEIRWMLSRVALIEYRGAPATLSVSVDVTHRRHMEEQLALSRANLVAILESTSDFVLLSDRNACPVYFNTAYAAVMKELLGIEMRPGLKPHTLIPDDDVQAEWEEYHRRVLSGEQFSSEFSFPAPDGRMRHFEHSFEPVRDGNAVVGVCEFTHEITDRKQKDAELIRLQREQTEQLQRVAGGLAHEVVNAVFPASTALLKLQERISASGDPKREQFLRTLDLAQRSLTRTIELTDSVRLFSRLDKLETDGPVDLLELVTEILQQHTVQIEETGVKVDISIPAGLCIVCPKAHLYSVVDNLVVNGINAMTSAATRRLSLNATCTDGMGRIRIADSGAGVPPELLDRIFEPFFTTRPGSGSGLGLAIVKRVVDLCGGSIAVNSVAGEGTTFDIVLPCRPPQ